MGKHVIRQTPHAMPSPERVRTITDKLPQLFFVAGSRGNTRAENKVADSELHGPVRDVGWQPSVLRRKHVVVLTHGYNCTTDETLVSAADFFGKLHASLVRDGVAPGSYAFVLFAWPGDTGTVYFDSAQVYAQHSGVALYKLLDAAAQAKPMSLTVVTHSLGAHVGLRGLAVLGERLVRRKATFRVDRVVLLAPAVEDDVFTRPRRTEEYHFPESAFGMRKLHVVASRGDDVLSKIFFLNEKDKALGYAGPQTMDSLVSLGKRVRAVLGEKEDFLFEMHDFSPSSATIMNPKLHVDNHCDYWTRSEQMDYYVNLIKPDSPRRKKGKF